MKESIGLSLATLNAVLNATAAALLVVGWLAIRAGRRDRHRAAMLGAFCTSALFLASYLTRFALTGAHRYPGTGLARALYLTVLASHTLLAVVSLPLILRSLWLARGERFAEHRAVARFAWPVWLYVSVTGVVVYVMLYHLA